MIISWTSFSWFCTSVLFPASGFGRKFTNYFLILFCACARLASWALLTSTMKPFSVVYLAGSVMILVPLMECLTKKIKYIRIVFYTITSLIGPMTHRYVLINQTLERSFKSDLRSDQDHLLEKGSKIRSRSYLKKNKDQHLIFFNLSKMTLGKKLSIILI
jgi:hypothetical protein